MRATIICILLSAVAISADLQADFDEIKSHVPMQQVEAMVQKYIAAYPSIRPAIAYLQTLSDEQIYKEYVSSDLVDYFNRRGIDGKSIIVQAIKDTKDFYSEILEQEPSAQSNSDSPAITGNAHFDLNQLLQSSDVFAVIRKKMETSADFANFVAAVTDPEFKALFYRKINSGLAAGACVNCKDAQARSWFSKTWKKIKDHGFGIGVSIPFGK